MAINIETVLTHDDLNAFLGGQLNTQHNLLPQAWTGDSKIAREEGLRRVLKALQRRTPPIYENDIAETDDLKDAVKYAAAEHIYRLNVTVGGEEPVFAYQADRYAKMFRDEMASIQITTTDGAEVQGAGFAVRRR